MQDTMEKLVADAMQKARQMILDGDEVMRTFFAQSKNGEKHVVVAPCASDDEQGMVLYLKMLFAIHDVEAYCMLSEVWMTIGENGKPASTGVRPSQSPDRQEALFAMTVRRVSDDKGGTRIDARSARAMITRNPTAIGDIIWDEAEHVGGRFTDLLPPAGIGPCPDVEGALEILKEVGKLAGIAGVNMHDLHARPAGASVH